jgi:hypothetical protein
MLFCQLVKDTGLPHQEVTRWFRNERHKEKVRALMEENTEKTRGRKMMLDDFSFLLRICVFFLLSVPFHC